MLLRVDAGPHIGLGHLQRCLAMASAFAETGCRASFVVNDDSFVTDRVSQAGWPVARLRRMVSWSADDAAATIARAHNQRATVVVVDSDEESPQYIRSLRAADVLVCAIEDLGSNDIAADVLLNGDAHAENLHYRAELDHALFLLGPSFTPLPSEYWMGDVEPARVPPASVLLTLGGGQAFGLMPTLLHEATRLPPVWQVHVVAGPFMADRNAVAAAVERLGDRATLHIAPAGLRSVISACDLAVTAAGQTLYELAALGRPAVAIEAAGNQREQLAAFEREGTVVSAGLASDPCAAARAIDLTIDLARDVGRLRAMATAGRRFVDGQGARRAAAAILDHAAHHVCAR